MRFENISPFDLQQTFDCGQCFRWELNESGVWSGVADGHAAEISFEDGNIIVKSDYDDCNFWSDYLDLERDYAGIISTLSSDSVMRDVISDSSGIRLLRQDPWEALVSFIISQNNNIPRIKKIINTMCESFGEKITFGGRDYYTFPNAEKLADADLSSIRAGFRAGYIKDAAQRVLSGETDLMSIYSMPSDEARDYLKRIKGVGDKVADCVLLFAYQKFDVFPRDVWIKRIVKNLYNIDENDVAAFACRSFGDYSGFAQQYLFYHART